MPFTLSRPPYLFLLQSQLELPISYERKTIQASPAVAQHHRTLVMTTPQAGQYVSVYREALSQKQVPPHILVPIGSVEFCESVYRHAWTPLEPVWLRDGERAPADYGRVRMTVDESFFPSRVDWFVKPADRYKRFEAQIFPAGDEGARLADLHGGPFLVQDILPPFVREWRVYYSAGGQDVDLQFYAEEEDAEALHPETVWESPNVPSDSPPMSADFGMCSDGTVYLIEAHHPYATGWYGDSHGDEADFYAAWCGQGAESLWHQVLQQAKEKPR